MKQKNVREYSPSPAPEDAFLVNPVASVNDRTGYVSAMPLTDDEAKNYGELFDLPCEASEQVKTMLTKVLPGRKKK